MVRNGPGYPPVIVECLLILMLSTFPNWIAKKNNF
jgi:hypothetical protein